MSDHLYKIRIRYKDIYGGKRTEEIGFFHEETIRTLQKIISPPFGTEVTFVAMEEKENDSAGREQ